jgi:hypothetical protein
MATFTTSDLPEYNGRHGGENMRFVVTESYSGSADEHVEEYGGEVVTTHDGGADREVLVVKFNDENEGGKFSRRVNGTIYSAVGAANYRARTLAAGTTG